MSLSKLPPELLHMVLEYIVHPADLKALCLVCKPISEPAFQHLYRNIVLPFRYDDLRWRRSLQLSRSQHLHYVQNIDIGTHGPLNCAQMDTHFNNNYAIVNKLPRDNVSRFSFGLFGYTMQDEMRPLWSTQSNLLTLQLNFTIRPPLKFSDISCFRDMSKVEELEVTFVGTEENVEIPIKEQFIMDSVFKDLEKRKVRSLKVWSHTRMTVYPQVFLLLDLSPRTLTRLSLWNVWLPLPDKLDLNKFDNLSTLELENCERMSRVLDSLRHPKLTHLNIRRGRTHDVVAVFQSTVSFLCRLESLQTLIVDVSRDDCSGKRLDPAILRHARTLKTLRFHGEKDLLDDQKPFEQIKACSQLKFLALPTSEYEPEELNTRIEV